MNLSFPRVSALRLIDLERAGDAAAHRETTMYLTAPLP
jgi:hypothetical protein